MSNGRIVEELKSIDKNVYIKSVNIDYKYLIILQNKMKKSNLLIKDIDFSRTDDKVNAILERL